MQITKRCRRLGMLLLLATPTLQAHGLDVMAQRSGDRISGFAHYSDRSPAAGLFVELQGSDGLSASLVQGKTDAEGRFELPAPARLPLQIVVEGDEGHRATAQVSDLPDSQATPAVLLLLREDIARLQQRLWWRDLVGGLGYLLGILGLWALWQGRRQRAEGRS